MNISEEKKKSKSTAIFIAVSAICLLIIGYFLVSTGQEAVEKAKEVRIGRMQTLTQKVRGMEEGIKEKKGEMMVLADEYRKTTGKAVPLKLDTMNLTDAERKVLEQHIDAEKNVSAKALLQEILKRTNDIRNLKDKIAELEYQLPIPHIANKGENHYQIALDFLVDGKGLEEKEAIKLLSKTALFDELAEGFKVWNFYDGYNFGTAVTQGNAKVSPNDFVHRAKKQLLQQRDKAVMERDVLAKNLETMEENQEEISTRLDVTTREKETLATQVTDLNRQVNSMFYRLDLKKNLKKKGILKGGFLRTAKLKDVSPDHFDRQIDLNADHQLIISAASLGVKEIKDVELYPRFYKKGKSYKVLVTPSKKHALLTLLDTNRFKSERIVIAVK